MTPLVKALRCLAELCGVVVDGDDSGGSSEAGTARTWRSRLPKGPALLSGLYNRARTESISAIDGQGLVPLPEADSVTPLVPLWKLLRWLLRRTMAPFLTMLWRWSFQGDLPAQADPEVRCMQLASGETPSSTHTHCLLASTTTTTTTTPCQAEFMFAFGEPAADSSGVDLHTPELPASVLGAAADDHSPASDLPEELAQLPAAPAAIKYGGQGRLLWRGAQAVPAFLSRVGGPAFVALLGHMGRTLRMIRDTDAEVFSCCAAVRVALSACPPACLHSRHSRHSHKLLPPAKTETKINPQLDDPSYLALADSQAALDAITRRQTRALRAAERALGGLLQGDAAVHLAAHGGAAGAPGETPGIAFRLRRPTMNSASWLVSRTPSHGLRRSDMYIESSTKRVNARRVSAGVVGGLVL